MQTEKGLTPAVTVRNTERLLELATDSVDRGRVGTRGAEGGQSVQQLRRRVPESPPIAA